MFTNVYRGLKNNLLFSFQVLQAVMSQYGIPPESFAPVCVVVDKVGIKTKNRP